MPLRPVVGDPLHRGGASWHLEPAHRGPGCADLGPVNRAEGEMFGRSKKRELKAAETLAAEVRAQREVTQQLVGLVVDKAKKGKEAGGGPQPEAMER